MRSAPAKRARQHRSPPRQEGPARAGLPVGHGKTASPDAEGATTRRPSQSPGSSLEKLGRPSSNRARRSCRRARRRGRERSGALRGTALDEYLPPVRTDGDERRVWCEDAHLAGAVEDDHVERLALVLSVGEKHGVRPRPRRCSGRAGSTTPPASPGWRRTTSSPTWDSGAVVALHLRPEALVGAPRDRRLRPRAPRRGRRRRRRGESSVASASPGSMPWSDHERRRIVRAQLLPRVVGEVATSAEGTPAGVSQPASGSRVGPSVRRLRPPGEAIGPVE